MDASTERINMLPTIERESGEEICKLGNAETIILNPIKARITARPYLSRLNI